jgi:hypothetical protein
MQVSGKAQTSLFAAARGHELLLHAPLQRPAPSGSQAAPPQRLASQGQTKTPALLPGFSHLVFA